MDWARSGSALACARASMPAPTRPRLLDRLPIAQVLDALRDWPVIEPWEPLDTPHREVFRLLVGAGFEPDEALTRTREWDPWTGELPDGQWIPESKMPIRPPAAVLVGKARLEPDLFMKVRAQCWSNPGLAEATLVHAGGLAPARASAVVRALGNGWYVEAKPAPSAPVAPTGAPSKAREAVERAIRALLAEYPLHWAILAQCELRESDAHETMWVTGRADGPGITLSFHPDFVASLSERHCTAVLLHEVHHLLFEHLGHPPRTNAGTPETRALAWLLATECTANEHIALPLPYEPIRIEAIGLPPNESTTERYLRLLRSPKKLATAMKLLGGGQLHDCGRPDDAPSQPVVAHVLETALEQIGEHLDDELRARLAGSLPGHLAESLARARGERLSWRELLRARARSLKSRRSTFLYPSRRAPDRIGVVPGKRARRTKPVVLIAIDTSGSMGRRELGAIAAEIEALLAMQVRVAVVQCDLTIQREGWMKPGDRIDRVYGRGGTSFLPVFEPALLGKYRPDLLFYFTDGHGEAPEQAPPGVEVTWVLTVERSAAPAKWGRLVRMRV
jgi:predicted metal-dependent peptidase